MEQWTIVLLFIQLNSHPIVQLSQASQPAGYVGCYPDTIATFDGSSSIHNNDGINCIGVCLLDGYRFAATQDHTCKCANVISFDVHEDGARCRLPCPGRVPEHCGGKDGVSLYDTMRCARDLNGSSVLTRNGGPPEIKYYGDNSPTKCASYCKENRYILSGTKENMCICGDNIKIGNNSGDRCDTECPGNRNKTCGGENSVLIRQTGYIPKPTTRQTTPNIFLIDTTTNSEKGPRMSALYITLAVVVIVAVSVILTAGLFLRHRRKKKACIKRPVAPTSRCKPDSEKYEILENQNLQAHGSAITTQTIHADDNCNTNYNEYSVVLDSNDYLDENKDYDKINGKQAICSSAVYSHLPETNTTDNTYSHFVSATRTRMNKTDNTYNAFQFSQLTENTSAPSLTNDDKNVIYDRATTRDKRQLTVMNEYAHLNTGTNSK